MYYVYIYIYMYIYTYTYIYIYIYIYTSSAPGTGLCGREDRGHADEMEDHQLRLRRRPRSLLFRRLVCEVRVWKCRGSTRSHSSSGGVSFVYRQWEVPTFLDPRFNRVGSHYKVWSYRRGRIVIPGRLAGSDTFKNTA